jgi:hypothetical protein
VTSSALKAYRVYPAVLQAAVVRAVVARAVVSAAVPEADAEEGLEALEDRATVGGAAQAVPERSSATAEHPAKSTAWRFSR